MTRIALILSAIMLSMLAAPAAVSAQPVDPAEVIDAYTAAINAHDVEGALTYVADSAVYVRPGGQFIWKEEIRGFIEGLIAQNVRVELVGERQVEGDRVSWTSRVYLDDPANPGAGPRQNRSESVVRDGLIVFHMATPVQ